MSVHDLSLRPAHFPLMRAMHRTANATPVYETVLAETDTDQDRMLTLMLALAPMAFAFFYLAFLAMMLFH